MIEFWSNYCFFKNYTFHKSSSEFCFSFFFSKSRVRVCSEVQTQTNCYMYAILLPIIVEQTWPLRKHDGQTEVSLCAVIGGFRSLAFVSFFAFAVCLFLLLFWLNVMKNAIVNGRKRDWRIRLNTTDKDKEQYRLCS